MPAAAVKARGFTLLELLVVLVIVGVMLSFAVLSVGDGGAAARVEREARRLAAVTDLGGQEAVMGSRQLGLRFSAHAYRFVRLDGDHWKALDRQGALGPHRLADGLDLTLEVDGLAAKGAGADAAGRPQVLLLSSGERTPFEVVVAAGDGGPRYRVRVPPLGDITVAGPLAQ